MILNPHARENSGPSWAWAELDYFVELSSARLEPLNELFSSARLENWPESSSKRFFGQDLKEVEKLNCYLFNNPFVSKTSYIHVETIWYWSKIPPASVPRAIPSFSLGLGSAHLVLSSSGRLCSAQMFKNLIDLGSARLNFFDISELSSAWHS